MPPREATPRRRRVLRKLAKGQTVTKRDLERQALLDQLDLIATVFGPAVAPQPSNES